MKIISTATLTNTGVMSSADFKLKLQHMAIRAKTESRPLKVTASISPDTRFFVTPKERGQGALLFYNNKTKAKRSEWTWTSLIVQALFPKVIQKEINAKTFKDYKSVWKIFSETWVKSGVEALVSVKKNFSEKTFTATVPIMVTPLKGFPTGLAKLAQVVTTDKIGVITEELRTVINELEKTPLTNNQTFPLNNVKGYGSLTDKEAEYLRNAGARIIVRQIGDYEIAMLSIDFTQREVEFLCNSAWLEVRPLDFYGVIRSWVDGYFGMRSRSATFSIPLARIAKQSDAKNPTPKLSEDGLLIDQHGTMYAIPTKLNSIAQYEEQASSAYTRKDGSFSAFDEEGKLQTPPPAMPVYVDWANQKFAYTSLDGKLLIQNLNRCQPVNVSHICKFLEHKIPHDLVQNFLSYTIRLAAFFNLLPDQSTFTKSLVSAIDKFNRQTGYYLSVTETPLHAIYEYGTSKQAVTNDNGEEDDSYDSNTNPCEIFVKVANKLVKFIRDNPTNAYAKYSVVSITELMAELTIFTKYAPKYGQVKAEDNSRRKAYLEQGEDPNFQLPAVPFVKDDPENPRGLMPHQFKVQNLLRDAPDNAIMPVDAGGGKTAMVLMETLKQMKASEDALSLVMCPSHLVAQYVKEFTYFVGNGVNVIPVTSFTIRRHGLEKLKSMIEKSPRNTVVVTDYNAILLKRLTISYGVTPITVFPIVEFLRQFNFKYVAADEAHFLKNGSTRNAAAGNLFIDIPKKRLASGTMVANTLIDLVRQIALIDPSIFGTVEDFVKEYALEMRGSKVTQWKPGAELAVNKVISQNVVIAGAKRKEWAAILPEPIERFHAASLTENQFRCYQNILTQVREDLIAKAQTDEKLAKLVKGEVDEDDPEIDINVLLKPYLARLERFLTAPGLDILGEKVLSGKDLISPKVLKINEICKEHLDKNLPGKILIFTNYELSATAIYEGFPPELKDQAIYYTASNKAEDSAEFERNPQKKIMVGIEQSLNTGVNLQFCSRLIRVETVWTPGVLEQGNSRIGRPNVKVKEARPYVYFDWIACNQTIDVTKISYLMAKTISTAKFYEAGNPRFDDLEVPPLMSMNLDTVFSQNDFETTLTEYFGKYETYKQAINAEKEEFKAKNKDKIFNPDGTVKMAALTKSENPAGSEVIHDAIYQPGLEIDGMQQLGLVRYDNYMKLEESDLEVDEDEPDENDSDEESDDDDAEDKDASNPEKARKKALLQAESLKAIGLKVHSDRGDGHIVRIGHRWVKFKTASGELIRSNKLATFVYTKALKSKVDIRTLLLQTTTDIPVDKPGKAGSIVEDTKQAKNNKIPKVVEERIDDTVSMELEFSIVNDFLGIKLLNTDNESAVKVAQAFGFKHSPAHFAAHVKLPKHLRLFFEALRDKGFEVDEDHSRMCFEIWKHMRQNIKMGSNFYGVANDNSIRNFYRLNFKPDPKATKVYPYPIIENDQLYIALPKNGHPGSVQAIRKAKVPGLVWYSFDADSELMCFTPRKDKASALIKKLLEEGVVITNLNDLKKKFAKLRIARDTDEEGFDE